MPRRTFFRGRSAAEKKAAISLASASESRTSPPATTSGGSVCRAALRSFGLPVEGVEDVFRCLGARLGRDRPRFGDSFFGVSSCFGAVASAFGASTVVDGLRLKETSFFRKSVIPLTVGLLRLGDRG